MLPITYYKELLHDSEEDYAIYIPSPFPKENRGLFAGIDVSSRYKLRGPGQYEKMARYLDCLVHGKKGNYMAFFPSLYQCSLSDFSRDGYNIILS